MAPAASAPRPRINWENFLGVKLFAWVGGLIAFLAAAFFIKYSFDNNLISPPLRVAIGCATGLSALVGGLLLPRARYGVLAQSLLATGILILYGSLFGAHALYHLIPSIPTFGLMALVTAAAFLLAVRLDAPVIAALGMLGGFLTPPLLSTGEDNPVGLFSYLALLDVGIAAVTLKRRWTPFLLLSALGTVAMEAAWTDRFFEAQKALTAFSVFDGFAFLFSVVFLVSQRQGAVTRWTVGTVLAAVGWPLVFAFYLLLAPFGQVTRHAGSFLTFVFLADLALLAPVWVYPKLRPALPVTGGVVFLVLVLWTRLLDDSLLYWGLTFYLLFAALHGVLPAVLQRLKPEGKAQVWLELFPALALILFFPAIFKLSVVPVALWGAILLIDALAFLGALLLGSILGIVAVLVLTLSTIGAAILNVPAEAVGLPLEFWLIGGFAALFFLGGWWMAKRISAPARTGDKKGWEQHLATALLPALSALLPFLLLILVVGHLKLSDPSPVFGIGLFMLALAYFSVHRFQVDVVGAAATGALVLLELVWHEARFGRDQGRLALLWYGGFLAAFLAFPFAFRSLFKARTIPWATAALAGPAQFYLVYRTVGAAFPNQVMGLLPLAFAVPYLGGTWVLSRSLPDSGKARLAILSWFGGVALLFITLVFPIQWSRQWITVGWAAEGAALFWLWRRLPHEGLRIAATGLLSAAFVRLVPGLNPFVLEWHEREARPILNWILYTYGLVAASLFLGARLVDRRKPRVLGLPVIPFLQSLGVIMLFILLNLEIADFYNGEERFVTFHFSGRLAQNVTYSIAWALFSLGLLIAGIRTVRAGARWAGLILLIITLCKLFLHDLWLLGGLYRISSLLGLAVVLLTVSFLYQRFLVPRKNPAPPPLPEPPEGTTA